MTIFEKEHRMNKHCIKCNKLLNDRNTTGYCSICRLKYLNPAYNANIRKKISESMKKAHYEGRAYTIGYNDRKQNLYSRPEIWCSDILKNNNINNVKHEQRIGKYFIDFLIDDKICIEMDGEQHIRYPQKLRDMEKDEFLLKNGYIVGRLSWKDCFRNPKEMIDIILNFITTKNSDEISSRYTLFNREHLNNEIYQFIANDKQESSIKIGETEYIYT